MTHTPRKSPRRSPSSPRTKILRQLNQLIENAEERRANRNRKTRRYVRHHANVPYARSRSRSRSSSRGRRMGHMVDEPIRVSPMSDDSPISPSGSRVAFWDFRMSKPKVLHGSPRRHNTKEEDISSLISEFQHKKHHK